MRAYQVLSQALLDYLDFVFARDHRARCPLSSTTPLPDLCQPGLLDGFNRMAGRHGVACFRDEHLDAGVAALDEAWISPPVTVLSWPSEPAAAAREVRFFFVVQPPSGDRINR